ncbi:MAG TPA: gephyrin-like molybdotransferase Glp [archaeon]|nr:gephyrin-like molybdotransferase Glp [archaeon]
MLTPSQAIEKVIQTAQYGSPRETPLEECCFLVAARDIVADSGYPFFSYSAMDGYAVRSHDLEGASSSKPVALPLAGEIRTSGGEKVSLPHGRTMRIMTGGALPEGADAVVKREDVKEGESAVTFSSPARKGSFINRQGEEIKQGEVLQPAGRIINPAALGLLATLGVTVVPVYPPPKVSLITTGDELLRVGSPRGCGQIYDSISPMLGAALKRAGVEKVSTCRCKDDPVFLQELISRAAERSDLVVTAGGVSVGDYDYICAVMENLGVEKIFWRVAQKPGKPLFFGRKESRLFFGLPGNPASAMVCFLLYVLPAVRKIMGYPDPGPRWQEGRLACAIENKDWRTHFMRGRVSEDSQGGFLLEKAGDQASYMLSSFAQSNALLELPPGPVQCEAGAKIRFVSHFWNSEASG